jgi:hypothetical protein
MAVFGVAGCGPYAGVGVEVVAILVELPSPFSLQHGVDLS